VARKFDIFLSHPISVLEVFPQEGPQTLNPDIRYQTFSTRENPSILTVEIVV